VGWCWSGKIRRLFCDMTSSEKVTPIYEPGLEVGHGRIHKHLLGTEEYEFGLLINWIVGPLDVVPG
jgi:hypothetical protein